MDLQQPCQWVLVSAHGVQPEVRNSVVSQSISACGDAWEGAEDGGPLLRSGESPHARSGCYTRP
jgi:hypothetical protein